MKELKPMEIETMEEEMMELPENLDELIDLAEGCELNEVPGVYIVEDTLPPEYRFTDPDPYFRLQPLPADRKRYDVWFDEDGHLHAKNPSAWWIPELTIEREIGGTVYTVTGSFNGDEGMLRKLERISSKMLTNTEEDVNDTDE